MLLSPDAMKQLLRVASYLRREHGQHIDMVKFAQDADYARLVLRSVSDSGNHEIVTAATQLLLEIDQTRAKTSRISESAHINALTPHGLRGGAIAPAAAVTNGGSDGDRKTSFFGSRQSQAAPRSSGQAQRGPSVSGGRDSTSSGFGSDSSSRTGSPPSLPKSLPNNAPNNLLNNLPNQSPSAPLTQPSPGTGTPVDANAPQPPKKRYISGLR